MIAQPIDQSLASSEGVKSGRYRRLFHRLINAENFADLTDQAQAELDHCLDTAGPNQNFDTKFLGDPAELSAFFENTGIDCSTVSVSDPQHRAYVIQQFAPIALTDGAWLRSSFLVANCHTPVSAGLFRIYQALKVRGQQGSLIHLYRSMIQQIGISMPAIYTRAFSQQSNMLDCAYRSAVIQLCLAYSANRNSAEIIGYTLARAFDPIVLRLVSRFNTNADPKSIDDKSRCGLQTLSLASLEAYLEPYKNSQDLAHHYRKIGLGIELYRLAYGFLLSGLQQQLLKMPNAADKALAVFRSKAKFAKGYHGSIRIGNRSLDSWFDTALYDGKAFLDELVASDYFDSENPKNSRFIKDSISVDGPMFGVFSASEIDTLLAWLRTGSNTLGQSDDPSDEDLDLTAPTQSLSKLSVPKSKLSTRELYCRLVNLGLHTDILPLARRYVDRCLQIVRWQIRWLRNHRCFSYDHQRFDRYVQALYSREMAAYKPVVGHPRFSEEVYRWGIEQFAPTLLVDGCWLQNIELLCDHNPEIGDRLGAIYADEIGSGRWVDNHANVYRRLLDSLEIQLPELDSREFAEYPGFLHSAFDLPAYFLAISQFPQSYLPEILGLNMAIELSGLGAGYMRLAESLEYWGIDAKIVRLHLSIDNLASGHSAIAKEAIGIYLDQVRVNGGEIAMQRHWRRIWTGYVSLSSVPRLFKWALVFGYFKNFRRFGF